jgi:hypothetical protein
MEGPSRAFTGVLLAVLVVVSLGGCGAATDRTGDEPEQPAPRTTWALRHRVVESKNLKISGTSIGHYDESTGVSFGPGGADSCSATVSAPGWGGPDLMVGEKIPTEFRGVPAIRSGSGAEGAYLMWQLPDSSWVMATCGNPDDPGPVDDIAAAIQLEPSSVRLPFDITKLPKGYGVSQIMQTRSPSSTSVYVGPILPPYDFADSDLEIMYATKDRSVPARGRAITVGGRPALLNEDRQHPEVCESVQGRQVCVRITPSDTGPYPNRSREIPTLIALADALTYAADFDDQSTWFAADDVFG